MNKNDESDKYYKISYDHEKDIMINDIHIKNNHCGRDGLYHYMKNDNWYYYGMLKDILFNIKGCTVCNKPY